jgi:membrane protease YdiL (CAAX protease family)
LSPLPPLVVRLVKGSLAFYPILSLLIWLGSPLGLLGAMYLALLVELLPALALAQLPLVDVDEPLPREPVYISSSVLILAMGGLGLAIGGVELGWEALGIVSVRWDVWFPWTVGLCLAAFVVLLAFHILRKSFGLREAPFLAQLLPKTPREKLLFFFLSLSAGAGEELAYRGFLIPALASSLGSVWAGALVSSVFFGLLHAYQGWLGIVRTAFLGFVLAASFILSGTLWPAILAHAILDVMVGLVFGDALVKE